MGGGNAIHLRFMPHHFGVGVSYASFVAASHAFAIVSTALNGICMNGYTIPYAYGRAMFIAMFTLESAYLGTPKHMSRRSSSGGTASLTSSHISNIWSIIYDATLANY